MKRYVFYVAFVSLIGFTGCSSEKKEKDCKSCNDFKTRSEAKAYAKQNKKCKKKLDKDGDGIYCESLPE